MPSNPYLFALGSNGSGQLGLGHQTDVSSPTPCLFSDPQPAPDDSISKIVAGGNHTLALFKSGCVFAAGGNSAGQLGITTQSASLTFQRVVLSLSNGREVNTFDDVAATWEASFFVKREIIYVRGRGMKGELGLGEGVTETTGRGGLSYIDFHEDSAILEIRACVSHIVVRTPHSLFGWGAARKGQLGEQKRGEKVLWAPERVAGLPVDADYREVKVVLGREFTFVAGEQDRWHVLLGERKLEEEYLPDLKMFPVADGSGDYELVASWSSMYALPADGRLRGWGRNDRGQLPPKDKPSLNAVAAGSEHCVGLTTNGEVVAWGWGEHGNCGADTDAQGNVAGRWNVLELPLKVGEIVSGVGAGCATTFIIVDKRVGNG